MEPYTLNRALVPDFWGHCARCGHTLLLEDVYCPSCGHQRSYDEYVK